MQELQHKDYQPRKYVKKRVGNLTTNNKIKIINSIIVDKQTHIDAARIHKVSPVTVRLLVNKVR